VSDFDPHFAVDFGDRVGELLDIHRRSFLLPSLNSSTRSHSLIDAS
jgi:hypothetical protein